MTFIKTLNRLKNHITFYAVSILLTINIAEIYCQGYHYTSYNIDDGIPQSYIYCILQDNYGQLWVGTGNGLSCYNGLHFETYTTSDSLADNFVCCGISGKQKLLFGHMNGAVTIYNGKEFKKIQSDVPAHSPVSSFVIDNQGEIWYSTYGDGFFRIRDEGIVADNFPIQEQVMVSSFVFTDSDKLLIGTPFGLKPGKVINEKIEVGEPVKGIPEDRVNAIRINEDSSGFYVLTEDKGLYIVYVHSDSIEVKIPGYQIPDDYTGFQDMIIDQTGNLWLASLNKGLIHVFRGNQTSKAYVEEINCKTGYPDDKVKTVFCDREGLIWSGNFGSGLAKLVPVFMQIGNIDSEKYGKNFFAVTNNNGDMLVATNKGLFVLNNESGEITDFYSKNKLPDDSITAICTDKYGGIWLGTESKGLFRKKLTESYFSKVHLAEGSLENSVNCIFSQNEYLWIGTKKGLFKANLHSGTMKNFSINNGGLPHNYIHAVCADKEGRVWITTQSKIISYIKGDKVYKIPFRSDMKIHTLGPIVADLHSGVWIGSSGNGIYRIKDDSTTNFSSSDGLFSDYCCSLVTDSSGSVWIGHQKGLTLMEMDEGEVSSIKTFSLPSDNLHLNYYAGICCDNTVCFGTNHGLLKFDTRKENPIKVPPIIKITGIRINNKEVEVKDRLVLPPGNYRIQFEYIGICLKNPNLVRYQYKLEGYDDWSDAVITKRITYNHVSEGNYTFMLKASGSDGVVSPIPQKINIVIKKPVWKYPWFFPALILISSILLIGGFRRREFRLKKEKQILEKKVLERTLEINKQKMELEFQRDQNGEKNANITKSIQYARYIQNAIIPSTEKLGRIFPESFVLSSPKDIVSGDFYWIASKGDRIMFSVGDCTGHGVPGAFMSLLGITLLDEIVNIFNEEQPDIVLTKLREGVVQKLSRGDEHLGITDGMDISLCSYASKTKELSFSGAMNNLVLIRNGEIKLLKGDKTSVCHYDSYIPFTLKEIKLQNGDMVYLFTDGFEDQFGGKRDKKYLRKNFYKTLAEASVLPVNEQSAYLDVKLKNWQGSNEQTDDITVMGIRF